MNPILHIIKMPRKALCIIICSVFVYFCSISNAIAGCTLTAKITSHNDLKCHGDTNGSATVTPSGGVKPYKYLWSPIGGNGPTANNLTAGIYIVTVTDSNGCIAKDSVTINQPAAISLNINPVPYTCGKNNGSATAIASGGITPYSYSWAPGGSTGATVNNLGAGTYTCTVTDSNGCKAINSTVITGTGGPGIQIQGTPDSGSCDGVDTAIITGGTGPYTYSWSPGGATTQVITGLCAGKYCCIVTDALGCKDTTCSTVGTITGINMGLHSLGISVYPVPATNLLFINSGKNVLTGATIEIYDVTGRKIIEQKINEIGTTYGLDISTLREGVYLLKLIRESGDRITRFTAVR